VCREIAPEGSVHDHQSGYISDQHECASGVSDDPMNDHGFGSYLGNELRRGQETSWDHGPEMHSDANVVP